MLLGAGLARSPFIHVTCIPVQFPYGHVAVPATVAAVVLNFCFSLAIFSQNGYIERLEYSNAALSAWKTSAFVQA